jgi:hypothetical protein
MWIALVLSHQEKLELDFLDYLLCVLILFFGLLNVVWFGALKEQSCRKFEGLESLFFNRELWIMNSISRNKFILQTLFFKLIPCFNFIFCLQFLVKFTILFQSLHHVVLGGEFDTSHSIEIASSVPPEFCCIQEHLKH